MAKQLVRKPEFFIVGAPRSGTTALHSYLAGHPQIFMNEVKREVYYFGSDLHYHKWPRPETIQQYLRLFVRAPSGARIGERSATYFHSRNAASEIREFNPSAKIIIMLRDPVDMMYSLHGLLLFIGFETLTDFEAALCAEKERKLGHGLPNRPHIREPLFYRDVAKLTEHVSRYLDVFGREKVHLIIFDDFVKDTAWVYHETLRFLNLDPDCRTSFPRVNENFVARSEFLNSFTRRPPALVRTVAEGLLGRKVVSRCAEIVSGWNAVRRPRAPLHPELNKRLRTEFRPEMERLSALLGRDLSFWNDLPGEGA